MLKPLHDHVVLEVIKQETKTKSGIILSDKDQDDTIIGKVVSVGQGKREHNELVPLVVAVGDKVVFKKYATTDIKLQGHEYLIIQESDILAIVED